MNIIQIMRTILRGIGTKITFSISASLKPVKMFNSVVVGILILHTVIGTAVKQEAYATGESAITNYKDHIDRGFTARKAVIRGNYIGFEKLIHDINVGPNNFNLDYGFFKAEKSGMHHFTFQFISTQREHFRVSLRLNGRPQVIHFRSLAAPHQCVVISFISYIFVFSGLGFGTTQPPTGWKLCNSFIECW